MITFRPNFPRCCLMLILAMPGLASSSGAQGRAEEAVVKLAPYTVRVADASIEVRFVLSGTQLFDPRNDPIFEARVVRVHATEPGAESGLQPHDVLLAVNEQALSGRTLREVAAIVSAARREPRQLWRVRRGFGTILVQHNGAWVPPLPGLER